MTNAKPVEPDVKAIVKQLQHCANKPMRCLEVFPIICEKAAALISQLTAERDDLRTTAKLLLGWKDRAEASEQRAKELEEGRDLDKVVLDEGIEILIDAEASNKLLSDRVAVLEAGLTRLASTEAFDVPRMANKEEQSRMLYADDVLRRARKLEGK